MKWFQTGCKSTESCYDVPLIYWMFIYFRAAVESEIIFAMVTWTSLLQVEVTNSNRTKLSGTDVTEQPLAWAAAEFCSECWNELLKFTSNHWRIHMKHCWTELSWTTMNWVQMGSCSRWRQYMKVKKSRNNLPEQTEDYLTFTQDSWTEKAPWRVKSCV